MLAELQMSRDLTWNRSARCGMRDATVRRHGNECKAHAIRRFHAMNEMKCATRVCQQGDLAWENPDTFTAVARKMPDAERSVTMIPRAAYRPS